MGIAGMSYDRKSKDLNIRGLMNRWMRSYLLGLSEEQSKRMKREFLRRIQLLIPFRSRLWGFKNPRSMFLLPFYHSVFPDMQFIHVVRDGRDMCFGNPFIHSPTYWGTLSDDDFERLEPAERMMLFWGESNRKVKSYGELNLEDRYLRVRFEDLCYNTQEEVRRIVQFVNGPIDQVDQMMSIVKRPKSIGRWKDYNEVEVEKVMSLGREYLKEFGYI